MKKQLKTMGIAIICLFLPPLIGLITNLINSIISPLYFITIMRWSAEENIIKFAMLQGIYEGLFYGIFFAAVFICIYIFSLQSKVSLNNTFIWILCMAFADIILWAIGGISAIFLSILSPEFYRHTFIGVPDNFYEMIKYAWVGGSIWGLSFGGILVMIIGIVFYRSKYKNV